MQTHKTLQKNFEQFKQDKVAEIYPNDSDLHKACVYAMSGSGKFVRPTLTLLVTSCFKKPLETGLWPALAVEMIHTYSLIHDDLPCMDDDDIRRGRPTVHKKFDEATALLAGDSLLTDAFHILASTPGISPVNTLNCMKELSAAAGGHGMIQGQDYDLYWTGKKGYTRENLETIHRLKTGALISAACTMGTFACGYPDLAPHFAKFGHKLGMAFQIIDDVLDTEDGTGKSKGKDLVQGKLTFLSFMGKDEAMKLAQDITADSFAALDEIPFDTEPLRAYAQLLLDRST